MVLPVDRAEVTRKTNPDFADHTGDVQFRGTVEDTAFVDGGGHRKLHRFHRRRLIGFISPISSRNVASGANPARVAW